MLMVTLRINRFLEEEAFFSMTDHQTLFAKSIYSTQVRLRVLVCIDCFLKPEDERVSLHALRVPAFVLTLSSAKRYKSGSGYKMA